MSEKRLRISLIVLLVAVAVASFGCGGGGSGANSATGGDFITSVIPDSDSTPGGGGNTQGGSTQGTQTAQQVADDGNQEGDGDNGSGNSTGSTPGGGGNTPGSSTRNAQAAQKFTSLRPSDSRSSGRRLSSALGASPRRGLYCSGVGRISKAWQPRNHMSSRRRGMRRKSQSGRHSDLL